MLKQKSVRERGKLSLSKLFSELNEGDKVSLVRDLSFKPSFPLRFQGKTGKIVEKSGRSYVVELYDGNKLKKITATRINLKKLQNSMEKAKGK